MLMARTRCIGGTEWKERPPFPLCFKGFVLLPCRRIRLEYAERVAFGVNEISLPAHTRHSKLWQGNLSASAEDLCCRGIKAHHLHRADEGVGSVLGRRRLRWTLQQAASRSFGLDPPVFNRQSFRLGKSPAKNFAVIRHGAAGIVGLNFKIGWRVHQSPSKENAVTQVEL